MDKNVTEEAPSKKDWRETLEDGTVIDHYFVGGHEWELKWQKISRPIPEEARKRILEVLSRWRGQTWEQDAKTYVEVPCASDNCIRKTWWNIRDLKIAEEKNFEHEYCEEFFCPRCRGVGGREDELRELWEAYLPSAFKDTDAEFFEPSVWQRIKEWGRNMKTSSKSLWVYGQSGVCKSRMMFELLKTYAVPGGVRFKVYSGGGFRQEREAIMRAKFSRENVASEAETVSLLVFDDFAQETMTAQTAGDMWSLIDKRLSNNKKTIFLANCSIDNLTKNFGYGFDIRSLQRRLKDFCEEIHIDATKAQVDAHIAFVKAKRLNAEEEPF